VPAPRRHRNKRQAGRCAVLGPLAGLSAVPVRPIGWPSVLYIYISSSLGRMSASAADKVAGRQDLGRAMWSVGSRELWQPRMEADGMPVTESNLSLSRARADTRRSGRLRMPIRPDRWACRSGGSVQPGGPRGPGRVLGCVAWTASVRIWRERSAAGWNGTSWRVLSAVMDDVGVARCVPPARYA
jgi:hypothetical protein